MNDHESDMQRMLTDFARKDAPEDAFLYTGAAQSCLTEGSLATCIFVILGASGDLTRRKLVPALYNLYLHGALPERFIILGCARTKLTDDAFRNVLRESLPNIGIADETKWQAFAASLYYLPLNYEDPADYGNLAKALAEFGNRYQSGGNRIFYLAIPPTLYETVIQNMGLAGLSEENKDGNGWSRVIVEKPFGRDLKTAVHLDQCIHRHFKERQIFRIDHYLAKETVQNTMMFRFANAVFEPIWNRRYIDSVSITAAETLGVENRAGYYDEAGVLRDMFQNHMMQLLSLTAMEPPSLFESDLVRDEKTKIFKSLRPFPVDELNDHLVLGQYTAGSIQGRPVPGYREEHGVPGSSLTPTFAMMKVFIDNWRWQGVPFYLTSGKRLARKLTEVIVHFKEVPHSIFRALNQKVLPNYLTMGIYPDEKISLMFQAKVPGAFIRLRPVTMDFSFDQDRRGPILDAYEKVLIDCMCGDQMLFWREDGVELCWSFLTPILEGCAVCDDRSEMLLPYEAGSWGPAAAARVR